MPQNIQAVLSDEDIIELNRLVEYGIFPNKDDVINLSIKILTNQEVIKQEDLIKAISVVNKFLMDNIGDLPFADNPVIEYHKGEKTYKFPVKTRIDWNRTMLLGFISIDSESFNVVPEISDSAEKLKSVSEKITKELHAEGTLL